MCRRICAGMEIDCGEIRLTEPTLTCPCPPKWLLERFERSQASTCVQCQAPFEENAPKGAQTLIYRCTHVHTRIHNFTFIFCMEGSCTSDFQRWMEERNYHRFFNVLPMAANLIKKQSPDFYKKVTKTVFETHVRTGEYCDHCHVPEERANPFKVCSGCKFVRYCTPICQKEGWVNHKEPCKKIREINARLETGGGGEPMNWPSCQCFNKHEWNLHRKWASGEGRCSSHKCRKRGQLTFNVYTKMCSLDKGLGGLHLIPTMYCSARCRKRVLQRVK